MILSSNIIRRVSVRWALVKLNHTIMFSRILMCIKWILIYFDATYGLGNYRCKPHLFLYSLMRFTLVFLFCFFLYIAKRLSSFNPAPTPFPASNNFYSEEYVYSKNHQIEINIYNILQILTFVVGIFNLLWLFYLQLCNHVRYVSFDTNLSICGKGKNANTSECFWLYLSFVILGLLFCECLENLFLMFIICTNPNYGSVVH